MPGTRKLGRTSDSRNAMMRAMVTYLLENGKIETTVTRAKDVRSMAEKMISLGKASDLHTKRQVYAYITKEDVAKKLFDEISPKYADRNGGYTRIIKIGARRGDAAEMAVLELAAQGDSYLAVYSYENGTVNAILEQSYEQYLVEDITGGGNEDLILMSTLEDGGVQIELLTVDRDGMFQQVAVMGLSADKFSGCAAVAAGLGADGKRYLVLDGWTGLSGNNLATVLLYFDEESQQMLPAEQISTSELYNASLRNVSTLVSRDLDGDGIVEIPTQPDEAGLLNLSQSRRMDFIVWMDYTSPEPEKSFGLLDEESSCYIELPAEWEGNLMLTDSAEGEEAVELRTVDEGKLVLTMRLVPSSESAAGWTRLGVVASRQMQAKFGPDVVLKDQSYRLSRSLYRLN